MDYKNEITTAIIAAKGSGKSVMLATYLNNMERGILFDMVGIFNPRSSFKTAVVPSSTYFMHPDDFIEVLHKEKAIPRKSIVNFGDLVGEELIEYSDMISEIIYKTIPRMPVLVDEVADIMPVMGAGSREFHRLVKNGRNHGNRPIVFATQRPQNTSKQIFDLCDTFYVSMQRAPRTIEYILELLDEKGNATLATEIRQLKPREFLRYAGGDISRIKIPTYRYAFKQ